MIKNNFSISISQSYFYVLLHKLDLSYKKIYIKKQPYLDCEYSSMREIFYEQINNIGNTSGLHNK